MRLFLYFWLLASCASDILCFTSHNDISYKELLFGTLGEGNQIFTENITDQVLKIYSPVSDDVSKLCRKHSEVYLDGIKKNTPWALRMLDSSSKLPPGILTGNIVELGNYEECVQIQDVATDYGKFSGQHCMVMMGRPGEPVWKLKPFHEVFMEDEDEMSRRTYSGSPKQWSLCVPSSCGPSDVLTHLQNIFRNNSDRVDDVTCSIPATDVTFSTLDWFAIYVLSLIALLLVLSTSYDLAYQKSASHSKLLASFSVYSNGKELLTLSPRSMSALDGIRSLNVLWVILGHTNLVYLKSPAIINASYILHMFTDWKYTMIHNGTLSVDSFFLLSGILACCTFLKKMDTDGSINIPQLYIHRLIRLTPLYLVVLLLSSTLIIYVGDGPHWDMSIQVEMEYCRRSWWANLLYIHNYVNTEADICAGHSWYLSADMQLYFLSPLILYPLWRWPRRGKYVIGILFLAGLSYIFLTAYIYEVRFMLNPKYLYFRTHARFTPWLIGVVLGYILHTTKKTTLHMSTARVTVGWLLSVALMSTSLMLANHFHQPDRHYDRLFESLYLCLMRPAWALGLAWVVFACVKGYGGFVNTFLSCPLFQLFSKLSYAVYFLHFFILVDLCFIARTSTHLNVTQCIINFSGCVLLSVVAAVVFTLAFEMPFVVLEQLLGKRGRSCTANGAVASPEGPTLHKKVT